MHQGWSWVRYYNMVLNDEYGQATVGAYGGMPRNLTAENLPPWKQRPKAAKGFQQSAIGAKLPLRVACGNDRYLLQIKNQIVSWR